MAHATTRLHACYLVRHAIAEARGAEWPDDTQRPLTAEGVTRLRQVARGLAALGTNFDQILTSPLVRACQTADALARELQARTRQPQGDILVVPDLAPDTPPDRAMRAVAAATDAVSLAIVGHEPDLGLLAAWLVGADRPLTFKKAAVCRIDVRHWPPRAGSGELIWFAPPKLLRMAGR